MDLFSASVALGLSMSLTITQHFIIRKESAADGAMMQFCCRSNRCF